MKKYEKSDLQISRETFSSAEDTTPNNPAMRFAHPLNVIQSDDVGASDAQEENAEFHGHRAPKPVLGRLESAAYFSTASRSIASPYGGKYHEPFMFAPRPTAPAIPRLKSSIALRFAAAICAVMICATLSPALSAQSNDILPLSQVRPGMQGYAYTIFAGDQIEKFDLEVIGVMPNFLGPQ